MVDCVVVMYVGKIVEIGNVEEIFYDLKYLYIWVFLLVMFDLDLKDKLFVIFGILLDMYFLFVGDVFVLRNKFVM